MSSDDGNGPDRENLRAPDGHDLTTDDSTVRPDGQDSRLDNLSTFARAMAAATPCTCSAQRERAHRAESRLEAVRAYADTLLAEEHRLPQEGTTWRAHVARSLLGIIATDGTPTDAAIEVEAIRLHEQKAGSGGEPWDSLWPYDQQKLRDQARVTLGLETDRD